MERYSKETERVIDVLNSWLQDRKWLVGDRCTYSDLSFVTWCHIAEGLFAQLGQPEILDKYPHYTRWLQAMGERDSVKEIVASIASARVEHGLPL